VSALKTKIGRYEQELMNLQGQLQTSPEYTLDIQKSMSILKEKLTVLYQREKVESGHSNSN
jgi:hypothetical protein